MMLGESEDLSKAYVPGEENENRTQRHLANETLETFLRLARSV